MGRYGAFKAALIHYTTQLAHTLAPKSVRANTVSPGNIYVEDGVCASPLPARTFLTIFPLFPYAGLTKTIRYGAASKNPTPPSSARSWPRIPWEGWANPKRSQRRCFFWQASEQVLSAERILWLMGVCVRVCSSRVLVVIEVKWNAGFKQTSTTRLLWEQRFSSTLLLTRRTEPVAQAPSHARQVSFDPRILGSIK
jgi:hypothetical protein